MSEVAHLVRNIRDLDPQWRASNPSCSPRVSPAMNLWE